MPRSNILLGGQELKLDADGDTSITVDTDDQIDFKLAGTDFAKMADQTLTLTSSTASRPGLVLLDTNADANPPFLRFQKDSASPADNDEIAAIQFYADNDAGGVFAAAQIKVVADDVSDGSENGSIRVQTAVDGTVAERMRLDSSGILLIGTTDTNPGNNTSGAGIVLHGPEGKYSSAVNQSEVMVLNRMGTDGDVLLIRQAGSTEGIISVSGSTVSYGGFTGLHESSGIITNTPVGTVVSTIDELDVYPDTQDGEDHPKKGKTRADHPKVKVSDSVGDKRVYGVVNNFNTQGKVNVASVGVGSIKVTGSCVGGDLLESNGDGTAKVQSDDIVRSKTIGKVTIGNSSTDVKLVSCVLYCG